MSNDPVHDLFYATLDIKEVHNRLKAKAKAQRPVIIAKVFYSYDNFILLEYYMKISPQLTF